MAGDGGRGDVSAAPPLFTIGHGTRAAEDLVALLRAHGVRFLADIRTVPRSRRNPQFNRETLAATLEQAGIGYAHVPALGGLRHPRRDSINTAWRNDSFRGYADHMQTPAFAEALGGLLAQARAAPTAVMCAESVPWRCHRSLLGDAATARGVPVFHIMTATRAQPHRMTDSARVQGDRVTYPG
jgi:uncharacterized protein (DUF488 family)